MTSQPQWQFVGSVPENYERYLVPSIFAPWAADLIEMAALQPGQRRAGHCLRDRDRGADRGSTTGKRRQCRRVGSECADARCCSRGRGSGGRDHLVAGRECFTATLG